MRMRGKGDKLWDHARLSSAYERYLYLCIYPGLSWFTVSARSEEIILICLPIAARLKGIGNHLTKSTASIY